MSKQELEDFVNDVLIDKGKIVAIEDTYGIKIVEIIENKLDTNKYD